MRRVGVWVTALFVVVIVATPAGDAATTRKAPARCTPGQSRLITANPQVEVYRAPGAITPYNGELRPVFGCAFGQRRVYKLGTAFQCVEPKYMNGPFCGGIDREVLAGPIVAYEQQATPCDPGCSWLVVVRDLRTGRTLRKEPTGVNTRFVGFREGIGPTSAIVIKTDGSVAWIANAQEVEGGGYQVHASDRAGSRLLASGTDIEPSSLALAGSTLYWMQNGKPQSATLN